MKSSKTTPSTISLIRSDLSSMIFDRGHGRLARWAAALGKILLYPRIRVVIYYRLSHAAMVRGWTPVAYWLQQMGLQCGGAEIHPSASIGSHFCLFHSNNVVVGDQVIIGRNFQCFHGVTLGDSGIHTALHPKVPIGQPIVGDDVVIYAGAKVIGPIRIGDRAVIGANSVVMIDVPADTVAVGIPARIIRRPATDPQ